MYEIKMVKAIEALGAEILNQENQKNQACQRADRYIERFNQEQMARKDLEAQKDKLAHRVFELERKADFFMEKANKLAEDSKQFPFTMNENTVIIVKDGDQWCAFRGTFKNLQESTAAFGEDPIVAVSKLLVAEETAE